MFIREREKLTLSVAWNMRVSGHSAHEGASSAAVTFAVIFFAGDIAFVALLPVSDVLTARVYVHI